MNQFGSILDLFSRLERESAARPRGYVGPAYRGASRDRALPGKNRIRARKAANRAGRILAAPQVIEKRHPIVAKHGLRSLEETKLIALRQLAKSLGLKGYSKMKKDELVEYIYQSDENRR